MALVETVDIPNPVEENALWPHQRSDVLDWLVTGTSDNRYIDNIFVEMCGATEKPGHLDCAGINEFSRATPAMARRAHLVEPGREGSGVCDLCLW